MDGFWPILKATYRPTQTTKLLIEIYQTLSVCGFAWLGHMRLTLRKNSCTQLKSLMLCDKSFNTNTQNLGCQKQIEKHCMYQSNDNSRLMLMVYSQYREHTHVQCVIYSWHDFNFFSLNRRKYIMS